MAGPDARAPIAIAEPGSRFAQPLKRDFAGVKIAWSPDLGELPVDPTVTTVLEPGREVLAALGCEVVEATPDLREADEVFRVLRAYNFELTYGPLLDRHRAEMKDTVVWNIEEGRKLSGPQLGRAEVKRTELYQRLRTFMEQYAFLAAPVVQVPPFDVDRPWVEEINGERLQTYLDWMKSCYYISATGLPAISVPCGFTADGLPVGLQIVGRHQDELGVLQLAYAFQQRTGLWTRRPPLAS
jgi:amidase